MSENVHVFGPVPSRRLGLSLGVSPIPEKTCNYTCTYCQLGRTTHMSNRRVLFYPVETIALEVEKALALNSAIDVVSIVGEGEPTLYAGLGELITRIKAITTKPVALITNAALFYDEQVRRESALADIVLPSLDGFNRASWKAIDRPYGRLDYDALYQGLVDFSHAYTGQLWIEIMLLKGINDSEEALKTFPLLLANIVHDRLYINTPVRPPAESFVEPCDHDVVQKFATQLKGSAIDTLVSTGFASTLSDNYEAVKSIILRHPMNNFEINTFLLSRKTSEDEKKVLFSRLRSDASVTATTYKGLVTYRAN